MKIAVFAREPIGRSLQMSGECLLVGGQVIGMDALEPVLSAAQLLGREPNGIKNAGRVVDLASFDVPVIDTFIDRLHS
jgi:hypothetical protein